MKKLSRKFIYLILILALFLRLFKLQELFHFTMDEAYVAFRSWGLFNLKRFFLIGASSPLKIHLPPYFFYLSAIFLAPFKFNPAGWGVWSALIATATIYLLYRLTKNLAGAKTAQVAALLYTFSFTAVFFDRHYWPLNLNPFFTLAVLLLLDKLNQNKLIHYLLLALILVLALSADPSNLTLLILSFISIFKLKSAKFGKNKLLFSATGLMLFFTPLLWFDLRHQWQNFSRLGIFFTNSSSGFSHWQNLVKGLLLFPQALSRFWYSPQNHLVELHAYCSVFADARLEQLPLAMVLLSLAILVWFFFRGFHNIKLLLLIYLFGISLYGLLGYALFDHYLTGLLPIFAFLTAVFLTTTAKKFTIPLITIFITFNLYQIFTTTNPYGLKHKMAAISWAKTHLNSRQFMFDSRSKCHRENGMRYLLEINNLIPTQSFMDPHFFWLYKDPTGDPADLVLLVTDKDEVISQPIIVSGQFGGLKTYILDNADFSYRLDYPNN